MAAKAAEPRAEAVVDLEAAERAAVGSAIRREDFLRAKLAAFKRRVDHSLDVIRDAAKVGAVGVSFSGGKDSVCCVDLVRTVIPDAPAAFFDSGAELSDTNVMVRHVNADTICPRLSMLDMARYAGWWGCSACDPEATFDAKRVLIDEPSETFVVQRGLRVMVHGVRASESHARAMHTASRGDLYRGKDGTWYCMPLARWSVEDVWAYIASRGLKYHRAYDLMAEAGMPRESWRVSGALGERGSGWGRHATLRLVDPDVWRRLVVEFPRLGLTS